MSSQLQPPQLQPLQSQRYSQHQRVPIHVLRDRAHFAFQDIVLRDTSVPLNSLSPEQLMLLHRANAAYVLARLQPGAPLPPVHLARM